MITKAELLKRLKSLAERSSSKKMTPEEYRKLRELAKFRCPAGRDPAGCDTYNCPSRGLYCESGPCPWGLNRKECGSHLGGLAGCITDYSDECIEARLARARLRQLMEVPRRGR